MFAVILSLSYSSSSPAFDIFGFFSSDEPSAKEEPAAESDVPVEEKVSTLDEDTPLVKSEVGGGKTLTGGRPFRAPDYSGQDKALGYGTEVFAVPKGLEPQVRFWVDIYSKYTTDQGVIHDTENVALLYEEMDFKEIMSDASLSLRQKERRKQKLVDERKKQIIEILLKLDKTESPENLSEREKKIWDLFQNISEPHKFREAAHKSRIRFQLGQKDRMQSAIFFSGRYLEDMETIFRENNLPIELTRLVFVESSFNVLARSKVGASGLWQIMRYTARPYRMINSAVDQRNHPMAATRLAARLMKDNYNMLRDWPLALTGYNHGPTGVRKLTEKYKTRNLVDLIQNVKSRRTFGFASRNFYACFMAVLEVEKNTLKYFPKAVWSERLDADEVKLPVSVKYKDLLTWFDGDTEKAEVFNPHLSRTVRNGRTVIPAATLISIPKNRYDQALISLARGEFKYSANMGPTLRAPETGTGPELKSADSTK